MTNTPERIWTWRGVEWYTEGVKLEGDEVEYIRADIHEARIKELEAQLARAQQIIGYVQALFDVHPYGQTINIEATHWMPLPDMPKEGET